MPKSPASVATGLQPPHPVPLSCAPAIMRMACGRYSTLSVGFRRRLTSARGQPLLGWPQPASATGSDLISTGPAANQLALPLRRYLPVAGESRHDIGMTKALRHRLHLRVGQVHCHIMADQQRPERMRVMIVDAGRREGALEDGAHRFARRPALAGKANGNEPTIFVEAHVVLREERIAPSPAMAFR